MKINETTKKGLILALIFVWVFSGRLLFPTKVQEARASTLETITYSGSMETRDVSGYDEIDVKMWGGGGGDGDEAESIGGSGGYIEATLDVSDINQIEIWVGGAGSYEGAGGWGRSSGGAGDGQGSGGGSTEITGDNESVFLIAADAGGGAAGNAHPQGHPRNSGGGGGAGGTGHIDGDNPVSPRTNGYGGDGGDEGTQDGQFEGGDGGQEVNDTYLIDTATETTGGGSGSEIHGEITITYYSGPTLTNPTGTATGDTTADGSVDTDQSDGDLYWVVTQSVTSPSPSQVKSGQNHEGAAADASGNQAVTATGTQSVSASELTAETTYYFHFMHENAEGLQSDVATSGSFITAAPTLTNPTGTATGETTADGSVDTDQDTGDLYWVVTQSATSPSPSQVKSGQNHEGAAADASGNQAVTATGTQSVSASELTAETTYYFHFMHENRDELQSDVATSGSFITDAIIIYITADDYHHLELHPPENVTYVLTETGQTITTTGDVEMGDGTEAGKVTAAENNPNFEVGGDFSIREHADFTASTSSLFSIAGNWENLGNFLHNSGTVTFVNDAKNSIISGTTTFYDFTSTAAGKTLQFAANAVQTFEGTFTITGADGNLINIQSDTAGTRWLPHFTTQQGTIQDPTVTYAHIQDSGGDTGSEAVYLDGTSQEGTNVDSNYWIWEEVSQITVSGVVYTDEAQTSPYDCSEDNLTIGISVGGNATETTTCTSDTGQYSTEVSAPSAAGDPIVVFIDSAETPEATTATLAADTGSNITNLHLYTDRVGVTHEDSGPITNPKLDAGDNGDAGIGYSVSEGNLDLESGLKLLMLENKTFTPGGGVATQPSSNSTDPGGDLEIKAGATLNMEANTLSVGGNYENGGTFSHGTGQTTTFTATDTGHTIAAADTFGEIVFDGIGGGWTFVDNTVVSNDFLIENGTVTAPSLLTVGGDWTNQGTFSHNTGTVTFSATSSGKTITDGGSAFYDIVFDGTGGGWLYKDGVDTAPNSTTVQAGTPTFLNAKTGSTSVTGGSLNVDWYLGIHAVAADDESYDINTGDGDITVSENSATSQDTVWRYDGTDWGTATSFQTTGTGEDGINPQPEEAGAIRIREYEMTSEETSTYLYNLEIAAQDGFTYYDYHGDHGENYLTSSLAVSGDSTISQDWHRVSPGSVNGTKPYSGLNQSPTTGTWYAGMESDLSFSVDSPSVNLGSLDEYNIWTNTGITTLTVNTSFSGGYTVNSHAGDDDGKLQLDGETAIQRWPHENDSPASWDGVCDNDINYCGFGYTTEADNLPGGTADRFTNPNFCNADTGENAEGEEQCWAGFDTSSANASPVAYSNSGTVGDETTNITYRTSADSMSLPGTYSATIYYIANVNY